MLLHEVIHQALAKYQIKINSTKPLGCGSFFLKKLWIGFNCPKMAELVPGNGLILSTTFPGVPGTHLIELLEQPMAPCLMTL